MTRSRDSVGGMSTARLRYPVTNHDGHDDDDVEDVVDGSDDDNDDDESNSTRWRTRIIICNNETMNSTAMNSTKDSYKKKENGWYKR